MVDAITDVPITSLSCPFHPAPTSNWPSAYCCQWPCCMLACSLASLLHSRPLPSHLRSLCSLYPNFWSYFVCPFILFIRFHIEVKSYGIGLSDWLIALGVIVCSSTHAVTRSNSSFLHVSSIPLCKCTTPFLSSHLMGTWAVSRSYCQDYCNCPACSAMTWSR